MWWDYVDLRRECSDLSPNHIIMCGLHHLIHKTDQGVHKGNDYERDLE